MGLNGKKGYVHNFLSDNLVLHNGSVYINSAATSMGKNSINVTVCIGLSCM